MLSGWTQDFHIKEFVLSPYHKKLPKQTFLSMNYYLLQHIQDLNNQPNGTKRGCDPLILEEELNIFYVPLMKTSGKMRTFHEYISQFSILPPVPGPILSQGHLGHSDHSGKFQTKAIQTIQTMYTTL